MLFYISHVTHVLCVENYILPRKPGTSVDWAGGFRMLFNARWIGTHRQAPGIKQDTMETLKTPKSLFSLPRATFLRNRAFTVISTLLAEKLYSYCYMTLPSNYDAQLDVADFLPTKELYFRRLHEITVRETVIRTWIVTFFLFHSIGLFNAIHSILAIIFVGIGLDKPEDWPPLFGDIRDATSISNFWSKFSHKLVYRSFTSYGIKVSKHVLRLPRSSFVGKLVITFIVFALSGVVHAVALNQLGYSCGAREETRFMSLTSSGFWLKL
jgi:uncharacterized membrane protein YhaH (DUF805 family)